MTGVFLMRKFFLFLLIATLLLKIFTLTGCLSSNANAQGRTVIRIAYLPITHSAAVMVLPEVTRYDENFYIQLVRFTAWPEVVEALRAGRVDGASILLEVAMRAFVMDNNLTAISLSHRDGNVIVVDNTIETYQDLIGRTVAIPHTLSPHNILWQMVLEREGMDINDINLIELSPAEMPFSMAAGAIAAYIVAEPWGSLAEVRGVGRIIETSNEIIPHSACCVFMFNSNMFDQHEGLEEWLMQQFDIATNLAHNHSEDIFYAFRRSTSFERAIIEKSLEFTTFYDLLFTLEDFNDATERILHFNIMDSVPNFHDFVR